MTAPRKVAFVIEDDPEIRTILRKYLEKLSFDVVEAGTGKSALALLEEPVVPALICLDLILPEFSGYDICEKIRASPRFQSVPVLVVSARSAPPDRALAEELGASAYLVKPIRWKTFSATVSYLVEH